jgi:hypothetical protein
LNSILLFPEKEAKSVVLLRRRPYPETFREAEPRGFGGWPPKKDHSWTFSSVIGLISSSFSRKRSKKRGSASQKTIPLKPSAKRNHGGLGAGPQKRPQLDFQQCNWSNIFFFFQKKKQKAWFCFAEGYTPETFREAEPRGFGGWPPKKSRIYGNGNVFDLVYSSFSRKRSKKRCLLVLLRRR